MRNAYVLPAATFHPAPVRRPRILAMITASLLLLSCLVAVAGDGAAPHQGRYAPLDDDHLRHLIHYVMERVQPSQKVQIQQIAHAAAIDLDAFRRQSQEVREPRSRVLLADVVDRSALEHIRSTEMRIADERSRRVDQLLVDVAAVLTPQQRALLRTEMTN